MIESAKFIFGNHTDTGKVRKQNEDYMGYFSNQNGEVFVVCDGMGGHAGGAVASQLAVQSIRSFLEQNYIAEPSEAIHQSIQYANRQIYQKALSSRELYGMGTTCVMVLFREGKIYYGYVGDSRLYLQRYSRIQRLTNDHSFVQALLDQGIITEEQAAVHPRRNELLRALGEGTFVDVTVCNEPIVPKKFDMFLLCTDGLNSLVSDEGIQDILNLQMDVQQKTIKLVETANALGGFDNITVQLIEFTEDEDEVLFQTPLIEKESYSGFEPPEVLSKYQKVKTTKTVESYGEEKKNNFPLQNIQISRFNFFKGGINLRPYLFQMFMYLVGIIAIYFIYQNTLGHLQIFGSSGSVAQDSLRAIQIENSFYAYFWNATPGLKNVKNTYEQTRDKIKRINQTLDDLDVMFRKIRKIANPLEQKSLKEVASKYNSKIEWILKANRAQTEADLEQLDSLVIPLTPPVEKK